tara:strand:+ start:436 stop:597 length:162 start_codon:yes stop_codon:yes gene_type:complete
MKANFKIKKDEDSSVQTNNLDSITNENQNEFEEYVKTLPKGWNLWSTRNRSNK